MLFTKNCFTKTVYVTLTSGRYFRYLVWLPKVSQISPHRAGKHFQIGEIIQKCVLFVRMLVFHVRPSNFLGSLFKVRHFMGCINHDIVVGLCSELLMRLSYYINLGYGKKFISYVGIEPTQREPSTLPIDQRANLLLSL